jgi:hypothetical protein
MTISLILRAGLACSACQPSELNEDYLETQVRQFEDKGNHAIPVVSGNPR